VLIVLTIAVDIFQIVVLSAQGPFMRYVVTVFEIVVKIFILVFMKVQSRYDREKVANAEREQDWENQGGNM
jgi:hypothetical protein